MEAACCNDPLRRGQRHVFAVAGADAGYPELWAGGRSVCRLLQIRACQSVSEAEAPKAGSLQRKTKNGAIFRDCTVLPFSVKRPRGLTKRAKRRSFLFIAAAVLPCPSPTGLLSLQAVSAASLGGNAVLRRSADALVGWPPFRPRMPFAPRRFTA